ncbi:YaaA family protein [Segatella copri]|uniref:YaaA family protein n=1 Tax=Segatella copri TaxID=165179 RepID=UPI0034E93CDE
MQLRYCGPKSGPTPSVCAGSLSEDSLEYAQKHLWITCFLYGLLRPMDGIVPYRMEHCVSLEATNDKPVNQFWKDKLTDVLIDSVKADDGILIHLSTEEYEHLFDWKRVCKEIKVIQPLFYVRQKDGRLKMQAVWAKSCRGAMVRYILNNQLLTPEELAGFSYEGFEYAAELGEAAFPHFVR